MRFVQAIPRSGRQVACWLLIVLVSSCGGGRLTADAPDASLPTLMPTPTESPVTAAPLSPPTEPQPADAAWIDADAGVAFRRMRVPVAGRETTVSVVRLDPARVSFRVGYAPDAPLPLAAWAEREGARVAINGGFFDEDGRSVALLIHDGQVEGSSYVGQGGMFGVTPEGTVWLRSLADAPYDPSEPLDQALQGWPMLVKPPVGACYDGPDQARARRSALAIDRQGRVLLITTAGSVFTLREFSAWLATADLDLEAAVNLDGGSSAGLILRSERVFERIDPFVPLPIVLLAFPRQG